MWDWERASVPYQPIYRRRLLRRRILVLLVVAAIVLPYAAYRQFRGHESVGQRVFDEVVTTVGLRYYDRDFHGARWYAIADSYRPLIASAPSTAARYRALRSMVAQLRDSHTAVFPPGYSSSAEERSNLLRVRHNSGIETSLEGRRALDEDRAASSSVDWRTIAPGVGYLRLASFPDSIAGMFGWAMSDLARERALILDLRGNPGGLVDSVDAVAGVFLPEGTLISSGTRRYHYFGPQRFVATREAGVTYNGRLVVLVDATTRSGAESLARALQYYHRATLIGTHTAGQVLGVDVEIALADGGLLRVATLDMRAPDGVRLEGRGVEPDVHVADARSQLPMALAELDNSNPLPACPVAVNDFWIDGKDPKRGYARFGLYFGVTNDDIFSAMVHVVGARPGEPTSVRVQIVGSRNPADTFLWPTSSPTAVSVEHVVDLITGSTISCNTSPAFLNASGNTHGETKEFDSSEIAFAKKEVDAAAVAIPMVAESQILSRVAPRYPNYEAEHRIGGMVVVEVTIGPGGKVADARVWQSSGNYDLNQAALDAARRSVFAEPQVDGKPATRNYLIEYVFRPM